MTEQQSRQRAERVYDAEIQRRRQRIQSLEGVASTATMLNSANLELLKDAALRGDWKGTNDAYLEFVLQLNESGDQRDLSALEWAIRLQDSSGVAAIVTKWLKGGGGANRPA